MDRYLTRKGFLASLGAAGLGFGMATATVGGARAQEDDSGPNGSAENMRGRFDALQSELYAAFTAALAQELGSGDAADVDSGIRAALATVVDGFASDDLMTPGQATALKALIETADVPIGPGPLMSDERERVARIAGPGVPPGDGTVAVGDETPVDNRQAMAERFYPDFTAALASELGAGSADEVDGAIRVAMNTVIDGLNEDDLPMPIPTDALKAMVAMAESPLGLPVLFGPAMGMQVRAFHGHGPGGPEFRGRGRERGGDDDWFGERGDRQRGGMWDERAPDADAEASNDDDDADDEAEGESDASA